MPNLAGAISSLLMSLPLIAVPCLAVFGLPSIGPATAEAEADDAIELGPASTATADALGAAAEKPPASAGFSPIVDAASTANSGAAFAAEPRADRQSIDRTSDRRGASANHAAGIEDDRAKPSSPAQESLGAATSSLENPFADVQAPAATAATSPRKTAALEAAPAKTQGSWEQVIARLKGKGAEEFYLANGETDGEFYFTCFFETGDNTTQRFEAEGATPLDAASTVLAEVEEWQGTR
jgi:hypothetical protein